MIFDRRPQHVVHPVGVEHKGRVGNVKLPCRLSHNKLVYSNESSESIDNFDEQESSNLEESSLSPSPNRKEPRSPGLLRNWDFKKNFNSLPRPGLKKTS